MVKRKAAITPTLRSPAAARWQEPVIVDRAAFSAEHPETVVSAELWARLESEISWRAALLEFDASSDTQQELRAELRARIIEAAAGYRQTDEQGAPIFDYLQQTPRYIVWHAAGTVYSGLRRERRHQKMTDRIELLGGQDEWGEPRPSDLVDPASYGSPTAQLEHAELLSAIAGPLSPAQLRVLSALEEGLDRGEIGERLGISRKTVHDHIIAIRSAALNAMGDDSHTAAIAADRHAVRRPSRRLRRPAEPLPTTTTRGGRQPRHEATALPEAPRARRSR
jgi:DNA-binding NarL/FixJ family response regulator